jgi:hypothetical protein
MPKPYSLDLRERVVGFVEEATRGGLLRRSLRFRSLLRCEPDEGSADARELGAEASWRPAPRQA